MSNDLGLDTPWAIGENNFDKILTALSGRVVQRIVEFGSGVSTLRLAQEFPKALIISVEHEKTFCERVRELLSQYHIANVRILHCPLRFVVIGFRCYLSYGLDPTRLCHDIDFVLIDGPIESQTLRGREATLYFTFPYLKIGGLVALHDYHRRSAKIVVQNWLDSYSETLEIVGLLERLAILRKCSEQVVPAWPGTRAMKDNLTVNIELLMRKATHFREKVQGIGRH